MAADPKLQVALEAKLDKFRKDLEQAGFIAQSAVNDIEQKFAKSNPLANFIKVATITSALYGIKNLIDALGELADRSQDLRLPVEQLQAISMAATESRVSSDELRKGLETFSGVSKKTAEDAKEFYKALTNIGSGFASSFQNAKTQEERLQILSTAMRSTTDEVKRAQLGLTAFGSDSERVTGFVANLGTSMVTMAQRAREMGIQVDEGMAKAGQEASTKLSILAQVIGNQLLVAVGNAMPTLIALVPVLQKVGAAVVDTLANVVSPEARPTATLEREVADIVAIMSNFDRELKKLQTEKAENAASFFPALKDRIVNKEIAEVEANIAKYAATLEKYRAIIAARQAIEQDRESGHGSGAAPASAFKPRPSLGGGGAESQTFERALEQSRRRIALMEADTRTVGLNAEARERARMVATLEEAAIRENTRLKKENKEVTAEQNIEIQKLADRALAAAESLRLAQELQSAFKSFGQDLSSGFQAAIFQGQKLDEVLKNMLQRLAGRQLDKLFELLANRAFSAATSGGGGGDLFGGLFGGARASGGPVSSSRMYLVGERGPELFRPNTPGTIVPNGGGGSPRINLSIHNNAGADISTGQPQSDGRGNISLDVIVDKVRGELAGDVASRRGPLSGALRGAYGLKPVLVNR